MASLLIAISLFASAIESPAQKPAPHVTLERRACYGWCPVYSVSISADGRVVYEGTRFVKAKGHREWTISPERLSELDRAFAEASYFSMQDRYMSYDVTDAPGVTTSYRDDKREKKVEHYHGDTHAPASLSKLEDEIDRIIGIEKVIGTEEERRALWKRR